MNNSVHVNVQAIDFGWQSAFRERIWFGHVGGRQGLEMIPCMASSAQATMPLVEQDALSEIQQKEPGTPMVNDVKMLILPVAVRRIQRIDSKDG
jgi:hypothetical protein